jgi:hypothetical protein
MKEIIKVEADTPEEMAAFLKVYKKQKKGEKRGRKMYLELLSFITNDTIPRLETADKVLSGYDIGAIVRDLKNFITGIIKAYEDA